MGKRSISTLATILVLVISIYFGFNSFAIEQRDFQALDSIALRLKNDSNYTVQLKGYADSIGSASYNVQLSEKRVSSVRSYLISKGVDSSKITSTIYGEGDPDSSEFNISLDRKVVIEVNEFIISPMYDSLIIIAHQPITKSVNEKKYSNSLIEKKKKKGKRRLIWTGWRTGFHWSTSGTK